MTMIVRLFKPHPRGHTEYGHSTSEISSKPPTPPPYNKIP